LLSINLATPQGNDLFEYRSFFSTTGEVSAGTLSYNATGKYYYNSGVTYSVEPCNVGQGIASPPPSFDNGEVWYENDEGTIYGNQQDTSNGNQRELIIQGGGDIEPDDFFNQLYFISIGYHTNLGDYVQTQISESNNNTSATWTLIDGTRTSPSFASAYNGEPYSYKTSFANRTIVRWYYEFRIGASIGTVGGVDKEIDVDVYYCYAHKQYATQYLETQSFTIEHNTLVVHPFIRLPATFDAYFNVYYWNGSIWVLIDKYLPNDVTASIGVSSKLKFEFLGPYDGRYQFQFYGFMSINYTRGF